jgi:hypothetical protein
MSWVKLYVTFPSNPKVAGLTDAAKVLYVNGLCYCGLHLTDGLLPEGIVHTLHPKANRHAEELVAVGLWRKIGHGYEVDDYLGHQRSRAQVEADREANRSRQERHRESRRGNGVSHKAEEKRSEKTPLPPVTLCPVEDLDPLPERAAPPPDLKAGLA